MIYWISRKCMISSHLDQSMRLLFLRISITLIYHYFFIWFFSIGSVIIRGDVDRSRSLLGWSIAKYPSTTGSKTMVSFMNYLLMLIGDTEIQLRVIINKLLTGEVVISSFPSDPVDELLLDWFRFLTTGEHMRVFWYVVAVYYRLKGHFVWVFGVEFGICWGNQCRDFLGDGIFYVL